MQILVTGAAGFIGSNFIHWALKQGANEFGDHTIVAFDSLTYAGNLENLAEFQNHPRLTFVKGDIRDADLIEKLIAEHHIDGIINFAAESHVDRSISDPLSFVRTNVEGTQILLQAARTNKVDRYLQISTDEVYGSLGPTGRFTEQTPLDPSSAYSASKASADLIALAEFRTHGTPVLVTRCTNNYGPFQFPEKLIPLMITNALHDLPLPVYGDGKNIRSWIHVDDHSRAIAAVFLKGRTGEVYNVGGAAEAEKENIEIVRRILTLLGKGDNLIRWVEDRKGHDRRYAVDYSKIKDELGWSPRVDFVDGLKATVEWYKTNQQWWQRVKSGDYLAYYDNVYGQRLQHASPVAPRV